MYIINLYTCAFKTFWCCRPKDYISIKSLLQIIFKYYSLWHSWTHAKVWVEKKGRMEENMEGEKVDYSQIMQFYIISFASLEEETCSNFSPTLQYWFLSLERALCTSLVIPYNKVVGLTGSYCDMILNIHRPITPYVETIIPL